MHTDFTSRQALPHIDQLIHLAKTDPEGLERLRLRHIELLISSAPEPMQRRLRGLQFQIDCQRRLHKHPMGACLSISKMMMDSLQRLNSVLHKDIVQGHPEPRSTAPASILAFAPMRETSAHKRT